MASRFFRWLFNLLFLLLTRRTITGQENLPENGPYILTTNHLSYFDTPLIFGVMGNENVIGWAAERYEHHWFFGPIIRSIGGIFIQRGEVDRHALREAVQALKAGKVFAVAPEGTRSKTQSLQAGKTGVAFLVHHTGVPVVPVAITGTEQMADSLRHLRRQRVTIQFGEAYLLPPLDRNNRNRALETNTDEIMCRIAGLLPEAYRGVYRNHPRLHEFLPLPKPVSSSR